MSINESQRWAKWALKWVSHREYVSTRVLNWLVAPRSLIMSVLIIMEWREDGDQVRLVSKTKWSSHFLLIHSFSLPPNVHPGFCQCLFCLETQHSCKWLANAARGTATRMRRNEEEGLEWRPVPRHPSPCHENPTSSSSSFWTFEGF